jgi:predicted RNA binding protein YcfA (HicA-like mRNA interferase family)
MPPKPLEIYRRLLREGWKDEGGRGSHRKMVRNGVILIVPMHPKELPKGTYHVIAKRAGWKGNGKD